MSHQRKEIRLAVQAALVAADTAAETRVYASRMIPFRRIDLPAIAVYTLEESSVDNDSAPRELTRTLQLVIEAAVRATGTQIDDELDDLAEEIERAMHADETFGGKCGDSVLASTEMDLAEDGDRMIGILKLTYATTYYTYAPEDADVTLDDLETVETTYDLGTEPEDQAVDLLEDLED